MNQWKRKLEEFMRGRYGMDDVGQFIMLCAILMLLVSLFDSNLILMIVGCGLLVYAYFRMFSKNLSARRRENMVFLSIKESLRFRFQSWKLHRSMCRTHKYYKCPKCGQKLRVPKGKGKIEVSCPKCGEKFIKKT